MIAKFHSAPGHSMETTLTINIPPVNSVRGVRSEREREKERLKDMEWERHKEVKEQEKDQERKLKEKERDREREMDKEARGRLMLEQDRTLKVQVERSVSYKDKFQKMREKYDKVTAAHEVQQRDLEILNAKLKKLQSENDLLLDAIYAADAPLYERYFPSQPGTSSPPLDLSALPVPNSLPSNSQLLPPRLPDLPGPSQSASSSHYSPLSMAPPRSMPPPISVVSSTSTSRAGPADLPNLPPPLPTMPLPSGSATSMPPPLSTASNGIAIGNGTPIRRGHSRRPSSASSTRTLRRRNDVIISPEDIVVDAPEANTTETSVSIEMAKEEDIPYSSPTLNGNVMNASPRPDTPISNVIEQASAVKHSPEHSPDEHESENDADHQRDPVTGGAHSGSEADTAPRAEEEKMDVDEEA